MNQRPFILVGVKNGGRAQDARIALLTEMSVQGSLPSVTCSKVSWSVAQYIICFVLN